MSSTTKRKGDIRSFILTKKQVSDERETKVREHEGPSADSLCHSKLEARAGRLVSLFSWSSWYCSPVLYFPFIFFMLQKSWLTIKVV